MNKSHSHKMTCKNTPKSRLKGSFNFCQGYFGGKIIVCEVNLRGEVDFCCAIDSIMDNPQTKDEKNKAEQYGSLSNSLDIMPSNMCIIVIKDNDIQAFESANNTMVSNFDFKLGKLSNAGFDMLMELCKKKALKDLRFNLASSNIYNLLAF